MLISRENIFRHTRGNLKIVFLEFFAIAFCMLGLTACPSSDLKDPNSSPVFFDSDESEYDGFVKVNSDGSFITLGTDFNGGNINEIPSMDVSFTYNFLIAKHETTCGEFKSLTNSVLALNLDCPDDSLPVVNVNYYDAILYANEKSKMEKKDTAYSYSSVAYDNEGHCTKIDGLLFNPNVDAFRLPTEAEWVLVASQNWIPEKAWTSENSNFARHKVCSFSQGSSDICDMMGNAKEWVNDWLGRFRDTLLTNYLGAPDGGARGERILKGGSFSVSSGTIKLYNRGDTYTVTSTKLINYVGFRLAYGKIPNPVWMGEDGSVGASRVTPVANSASIRALTKTFSTRIVFKNDVTHNLAFIDYSNGSPSVVELHDSISLDAYHPDISPDGKYVAFSTGMEGSPGVHSFVYVRELTTGDAKLVKLEMEGAVIPRWRVLPSLDTVIVFVTDANDNVNTDAFLNRSTWQVPFANGTFGVPQKLFDGAYHGGVSADGRLAVTGSTRLRSRISDSVSSSNNIWYAEEQACNVSLANDGSKRTLFLDFAGNTGKAFVGEDYKVHERLFVVDSTGQLIQSVKAPEGFKFDHTEWVRSGAGTLNFVIATLTNVNEAHVKIVLINLDDSSVIDLLVGDELWHPCMWVKESSLQNIQNLENYDTDSLCYYYDSDADPLLSVKMNVFWAYYNVVEVVALGSSRMSMGFESEIVGNAINMATVPNDMEVNLYLAENYVLNHCGMLKTIVVGVDPDLWYEEPSVNLKKNVLSFPGYFYDYNHKYWRGEDCSVQKNLSLKNINENTSLYSAFAYKGWAVIQTIGSWSNEGFSEYIVEGDSTWSDSPATYEYALDNLKRIIELSLNHNVNVVGVVFPQSPLYIETGSYGRHGMRRSHAEKVLKRVEEMQSLYPNFVLLDENKMGMHDYPDSMAYDYDHLNLYGAAQITTRIDSVIKTFGN